MNFIISKYGISPDEGNIKVITLQYLQIQFWRVLYLVQFYFKFIPNLFEYTENLRNFTRISKIWSEGLKYGNLS